LDRVIQCEDVASKMIMVNAPCTSQQGECAHKLGGISHRSALPG
jgi:hypothetical protein